MNGRWKNILGALALLSLCGAAYQETYVSVRARSGGMATFWVTGLTGNDSTTYTATPIRPQLIDQGDPTIVVVPRHSVNTATCTVEVGLYSYKASTTTYTWLGVADIQTDTATLRTDGTGYVSGHPLTFSSLGADAYDVRVTAASSGTVSLKAWTIGYGSKAAE